MRSPCDQRVHGLRMENLLSPSARGADTDLYTRPIPNQTCISLDSYVWSTIWECHLSQRHNSRVQLPPAQTWASCCPLLISQVPTCCSWREAGGLRAQRTWDPSSCTASCHSHWLSQSALEWVPKEWQWFTWHKGTQDRIPYRTDTGGLGVGGPATQNTGPSLSQPVFSVTILLPPGTHIRGLFVLQTFFQEGGFTSISTLGSHS